MDNKFLILLGKAVGTVVLFFICDLVFQYFDTGIVDYTKAVRFALLWYGPCCWQGDFRLF